MRLKFYDKTLKKFYLKQNFKCKNWISDSTFSEIALKKINGKAW